MNIWKKLVTFLLIVLLVAAITPAAFADEALDTQQLTELLAIAESAREKDFTAESWQEVVVARDQARAALNSGSQEQIDAATAALALALSKIANMDYSAVEEAIEKVEEFLREEEMADYWQDLQDALAEAESLYGSGDQAAVNRAAEKINLRLAELQEYIQNNRKSPTLWIVLFSVSLAGNVALAAILLLRLGRKNKNQVDDMPLVEYDIDDDIT